MCFFFQKFRGKKKKKKKKKENPEYRLDSESRILMLTKIIKGRKDLIFWIFNAVKFSNPRQEWKINVYKKKKKKKKKRVREKRSYA